jgi:methylmalonyl-CoA mutase
MIDDMLRRCDFPTVQADGQPLPPTYRGAADDPRALAKAITLVENFPERHRDACAGLQKAPPTPPVLGITGTGGAGKSSLIDELLRRFLLDFPTTASPCSASTRRAARPAAPCSAIASA